MKNKKLWEERENMERIENCKLKEMRIKIREIVEDNIEHIHNIDEGTLVSCLSQQCFGETLSNMCL